MEQFEALLRLSHVMPVPILYLLIGLGAALENLLPPIPSDLMVVLGGVLADRGVLRPHVVLGVAWAANSVLATFVYLMARRYGAGIFRTRWGHRLLRPHQLTEMSAFYRRYGVAAIFFSRFLPVFRVLVPAFAGITRLGFWRAAIPIGAASAIWYLALVAAGILASRNVPRLVGALGAVNGWLLGSAVVVLAGVLTWWWRSRRERLDDDSEKGAASGSDDK